MAIKYDKFTAEALIHPCRYEDGTIDNHFVEEAEFPTSFRYRRLDLFWNYQLPNGKHNIKVVVDKQNVNALLRSWEYIVYSDKKQQSSY